MSKWERRKVPPLGERLIGFSVPVADDVLILTYGGSYLLRLGTSITLAPVDEADPYASYDPKSGLARCQEKTFKILGIHGGNPINQSAEGESLALEVDAETVKIVRNHQSEFEMKYENFSGDWVAATFSPDGRYVILGCPYDFDFVVLERVGNV